MNEVEEKIQTALGINHLTSLYIRNLVCKPSVANEFLDLLTFYDHPDHSLEKLTFFAPRPIGPFEDEVITRLANMCPSITHLELSYINNLGEADILSMVSLFRQIIEQNPQL